MGKPLPHMKSTADKRIEKAKKAEKVHTKLGLKRSWAEIFMQIWAWAFEVDFVWTVGFTAEVIPPTIFILPFAIMLSDHLASSLSSVVPVMILYGQYPLTLAFFCFFVRYNRNHITSLPALCAQSVRAMFKRQKPPPVGRLAAVARAPRIRLDDDITYVLKSVLASENHAALIDFFLSPDSIARVVGTRHSGGLSRFWSRGAENEMISGAYVDSFGSTPLHICAANNLLLSTRWLIEHGADVNVVNERGLTPLHTAAWHGNRRMVEALLEFGGDARIEDGSGRIPADIAKQFGYFEIASRLNVATRLKMAEASIET